MIGYSSTMPTCLGCGGPFGNCWCVAEAMRALRDAAKIERQIRVAVARKSRPPAPRPRDFVLLSRRPERVVATSVRVATMRHYAGRR